MAEGEDVGEAEEEEGDVASLIHSCEPHIHTGFFCHLVFDLIFTLLCLHFSLSTYCDTIKLGFVIVSNCLKFTVYEQLCIMVVCKGLGIFPGDPPIIKATLSCKYLHIILRQYSVRLEGFHGSTMAEGKLT